MNRQPPNKSDFIRVIRLNLASDLSEIFREINSNEKLRAVVLIFELKEAFLPKSQLEIIKNCSVPVILALKKCAPDFSFDLTQAAHLCIAADNVKFIMPEKTGKISADEAEKIGLINKSAPIGEVETQAFALAEKIEKLAPLAVRACLKAVVEGFEMSLENGLKLESELFSRLFASRDMREGTRAFLEKRPPVFQGK